MELQKVQILGISVSAINMTQAAAVIEEWVSSRKHHYVCVTGVHGVMESRNDEQLRRIHNEAGLVTPDGMPLVWLSRLKGQGHVRRVYGPDLMLELCRRSLEKKYRHFFYGGAEGVAEKLTGRLRQKFPGIEIAGTLCPPFRTLTEPEDAEIIANINRARPDIVWVGLSTPKQERWMAEHVGKIQAPVLIGVGAAFDFHAGVKKQAPRWMQRSGLEWLFRLIQEPRRLAGRYLVNNPKFVAAVIKEWLTGR